MADTRFKVGDLVRACRRPGDTWLARVIEVSPANYGVRWLFDEDGEAIPPDGEAHDWYDETDLDPADGASAAAGVDAVELSALRTLAEAVGRVVDWLRAGAPVRPGAESPMDAMESALTAWRAGSGGK